MIRIVSDTLAGLPGAFAAERQIPIVPQVIIFGEEQFLEVEELNVDQFMAKLRTAKTLPKTAAPAPDALAQAYRPFVEAGDTILSIHASAELSGTIRSAMVAAQSFPGADIRILDTRTIGAPIARMITQAQHWIDEGGDADSVMARLQALIPRMRIYFLVDTLEYLQRGGRIGGASAFLGGLLQMKPILTLEDGRVEPVERQRTRQRALTRLKQLVVSQSARGEEAMLTVMHADNAAGAQELARDLRSAVGAPDVYIIDLVPAIVTHAGPGALAAGFFTPEAS